MKYILMTFCMLFALVIQPSPSDAQAPAQPEMIEFCGTKWPKDSPEVRCDFSYRQGKPILKPADMDALLSFSSIQKLHLRGRIPEPLAKRLKELKELKVLHLDGAMLQNVSPMTHMKKLKELAFIGTAPLDYRPLRTLRTLRSLSIERSGAPRRFSLKQFTKIRKLEHFSLKLRSKFPIDLRPLKRIKTLKSLELKLKGMSKNKNKKAIASLRRLRVLKLNYLPSRRVLKKLFYLEELHVTNSPKTTSLTSVFVLKKLKILDITRTKVTRLELHRYRKKFPNVDIRGCTGAPPESCWTPRR